MKPIIAGMVAGIAIWILRMAGAIAFLDENGRLPVVLVEGRLPGNVEYFFTVLMVIYCAGAAVATYVLFKRFTAEPPVATGVKIAVGIVLTFVVADAAMEVFVAHRGWAHHLRNVVIDYVPLAIIPIFGGLLIGMIQDKRQQ